MFMSIPIILDSNGTKENNKVGNHVRFSGIENSFSLSHSLFMNHDCQNDLWTNPRWNLKKVRNNFQVDKKEHKTLEFFFFYSLMNRNCNSKQKWDGKQNMSKYKKERERLRHTIG